jgi:glucan phosphorylase
MSASCAQGALDVTRRVYVFAATAASANTFAVAIIPMINAVCDFATRSGFLFTTNDGGGAGILPVLRENSSKKRE